MDPLKLTINGKIIDHLGIQMYQSPVAAIAELISNSWDADARNVEVTLPDALGDESEIVIIDDGTGMTYVECQDRYLNVGAGRRDSYPDTTQAGRKVLGRKGIGKFAGFGIANEIMIETISEQTGELTRFSLNVEKIRVEKYAGEGIEVDDQHHETADDERKRQHGTKVILRKLKLKRTINPGSFSASMTRRFMLQITGQEFRVTINGEDLPENTQTSDVEFTFPTDYQEGEAPGGLTIDEHGWALERLPNEKNIRWKFHFYKDTIGDEEFRGIAIYAHGKLAQKPFFFNLSGGLGGQHGQQYMSGQVIADYVDELDDDIISPERQRINFEHEDTIPLQEWGQQRVKELLMLWKSRRGEKRKREIEEKVTGFSDRLERLPRHERKTVEGALKKLGSISTLDDATFQDLGTAMLGAWEQGRLKELMHSIGEADDLSAEEFVRLLDEAKVVNALNLAESVNLKLDTIDTLKTKIEGGTLENELRDFIGANPWLLNQKWETFQVERAVQNILTDAARQAGLEEVPEEGEEGYRGRVDLALKSGDHLLVVELMRPGKTIDFDHLDRCNRYVLNIQEQASNRSALGIEKVTGLVVGDRIESARTVGQRISQLKKENIYVFDWSTLFAETEAQWREFQEILWSRVPDDDPRKEAQ